jgi:acyl-ACP thioesterase
MNYKSMLSKKYHIIGRDVDYNKKLKLSALFSYLEDIAGLNAMDLGIDQDVIAKGANAAWIISRMRLQMDKYPSWKDDIIIETWPQLPQRFLFERDYIIKAADGEVLGRGASVWAIIDIDTRRPLPSDTIKVDYPEIKTERAIDTKSARMVPFGDTIEIAHRPVCYSDIDMNGHVNNSRYLDYIMDCYPVDLILQYPVKELQINYVNEALPGETVVFYRSDDPTDERNIYVEGRCQKDNRTIFKAIIHI